MKPNRVSFATLFAKAVAVTGLLVGLGIAVMPTANAQVVVTGFYNQVGADFFYNFQVENQGGLDVLVADVIIPGSNAFTITGETAPTGFQISVDAVTGRIGLVSDSATFAPLSIVSGFTLTSSGVFPDSAVEVTDVNGAAANGTFVSVAVPETGTLSLGLIAGSALGITLVSRRRRTA